MSLINEALKKAQKQRTGEAPTLSSMPSIGGERPGQIARRTASPGLNALLLRLGLGVAALVILVLGGLLIFRDKDPASTPAPVAVAVAPVAPAPAPVLAKPTPAPTAATTPSSASTFVVPNVSPATASAKVEPPAASAKVEPAKPEPVQTIVAQTPAPAPVVEQPKPEPAKPAAPAPRLEARAINFIEAIRVAGIRASATDSKVLMNDRVYRIGNLVEAEMGLRLVEITANSLTFEDERGGRYTRNF